MLRFFERDNKGASSKIKPTENEVIEDAAAKKDDNLTRRVIRSKNGIKSYFKEFTDNTSLHGLKYVGEEKTSFIEKIWWISMIILSFVAGGYLIHNVWMKWEESPVIVSFAETPTPVWQVPFPAITICSEIKSKRALFNFTEMYHRNAMRNLTEQEKKKYESFVLLCHSLSYSFYQKEGDKRFLDKNFTQYLFSVAPDFNETIVQCKWKDIPVSCSRMFTPILTEEGICYTFNMLSIDELFREEVLHKEFIYVNNSEKSTGWSLDKGYPVELPLRTYPYRAASSGVNAGVSLVLKASNNDLDHVCRGPQGFKILLHNPSEYPRVTQQFFRVPLSQEVIASVKPNMMSTADCLRQYDPNRRQCYFQGDRKLKYFKIYTQQNCEWECLTNYTREACGCVAIAMPRNYFTPVCSVHQSNCVSLSRDQLVTREITKSINKKRFIKSTGPPRELDKIADQCRCLPECTAITYSAETSQVDNDYQQLYKAIQVESGETKDTNIASVKIYFRESQFISHKRSELFGLTDFLANCGGLLGLFLGFSFLSLIELVYFFTLRLCCNIKTKTAAETKKSATLNIEIEDI